MPKGHTSSLASLPVKDWISKTLLSSHPPHDVMNSVNCIALRNPRGLEIRYRDQRLFLKSQDRDNNDTNDSTYAPSIQDNINNGDESDKNDDDNDTNFIMPPDQEIAQGTAGV